MPNRENASELLQEIKELRHQALSLVHMSPIALFVIQEGRFRITNGEFRSVTGYSEHELEVMDPLSLVAQDERPKIKEKIDHVRSGKEVGAFETRMIHKDGSVRWVLEAIASVQYDEQQAIFGGLLDITDRKIANQRIHESENRYRTIFENTGTATIILKEDTKIALANSQFEALSGYTKAEIEGNLSWTQFVGSRGDLERLTLHFDQQRKDPVSQKQTDVLFLDRHNRFRIIHVTTSIIPETGESVASLQDITERQRAELEVRRSLARMRQVMEDTIHAMATTIEIRDPYTAGHMSRVASLAADIARKMELLSQQVIAVEMAAAIHDVGKVTVPSEILSKPGRINEYEFGLIRMHSQAGYDVLRTVDFPWPLADIVLQHHEKLDGSGYPFGVKGAKILLEARIITVADILEAMASHRPYRAALPMQAALDELKNNAGRLYDEQVVEACLAVMADRQFVL